MIDDGTIGRKSYGRSSMTLPDLFSLLADETRLRLLLLLQRAGELCVCDLVSALETTQPKISRHLALLRRSGVVCDERRGQWVYYRMGDVLEPWARDLLIQLAALPRYAADFARLKCSKDRCC